MSSSEEEKEPGRPSDPGENEEVEILEVVGVDVDSPATSGISRTLPRDEEGEAEEVVLSFDEERVAAPPSRDDLLLRLRADYENLRKRIDKERQEFELNANSALVGQLLPVLDNFERALALEPPEGHGRAFREGFVLIYKQLTDELRREGLRSIDAVGRPFDPVVHHAVATDASSPAPPNTVTEELRRGYLFQDRVLRPALVRVSTDGKEPPQPAWNDEES